jgi:hypothetical protein
MHTYMHRETYQKLKEKTKLNIDWSNSEKTKKKKKKHLKTWREIGFTTNIGTRMLKSDKINTQY